MEGILWKWTNYWNGWQTRWFVLENNTLSYYKSQEEVSQGCKGSVKVSVCQINVNSNDATRLNLVIPGEHHMYLKAPSPQDRQKWLVAIGSAKACYDLQTIDIKGVKKNSNSIYDKKTELRLYCDLMMQQVHEVKETVQSDSKQVDTEKLNEITSLLSSTCDTFIRTLEECMKLSTTNGQNDQHSASIMPSQSVSNSMIQGQLLTRSQSHEAR